MPISTTTAATDAGRLALMLGELRLPTIARAWPDLAEVANREGWPAARFLAALLEHELADRARRRIERHLAGPRRCLGPPAARQDLRQLRLHRGADGQPRPCHGAGRQ